MSKLLKSKIDALKPVDGRDAWLWDATLPGFGVRAQVSGRKTYVARYRTQRGIQRKMTIGRCTDLTPDQARELARKVFGQVAAGQDPAEEKQAIKEAPTVRDLSERYMREHSYPNKKPNSIRQDERNWRLYILPAIGSKKVEDVRRSDILAIIGKLTHSPATMNLVKALVSVAFKLAIEWEWRSTINPATGIKRQHIPHRENILTPKQLATLNLTAWQMVHSGDIYPQHARLFRLLALTGCRLREIMHARQEWVDRNRRILFLPDSKVGQRRISLPQEAMGIIDGIPAGEWLIPAPTDPTKPMSDPYREWNVVIARAGLPLRTRPHDLRHTFGSLGHRAGLSQRQIADMLGHRTLATTERYLHGFVEDRAHAVETVANVISTR